jgi:hypothetical protein
MLCSVAVSFDTSVNQADADETRSHPDPRNIYFSIHGIMISLAGHKRGGVDVKDLDLFR